MVRLVKMNLSAAKAGNHLIIISSIVIGVVLKFEIFSRSIAVSFQNTKRRDFICPNSENAIQTFQIQK
jgi:hypothetical protein